MEVGDWYYAVGLPHFGLGLMNLNENLHQC